MKGYLIIYLLHDYYDYNFDLDNFLRSMVQIYCSHGIQLLYK